MSGYDQLPPDFLVFNYTQTLDHFGFKPESNMTFKQKYIINSKYWGGANTTSPIFVYTGDEAPIEGVAAYAGFIVELASRFKAFLLYIEHRYYGDSMPFGDRSKSFQDTSTLGYFTSAQALADYAQLITCIKKNLSAQNSPVIAVGGSYGGMLASWFRLKYPHIVIGALASSAPILYFEDITPHDGYGAVVTKDFRETSENCYSTIRESWFEIDKVAAQTNGLMNLSNIFATCMSLNSSRQLKNFLELSYMSSAQYDNPPYDLVGTICRAIDGVPQETYILDTIAKGLNASFGGDSCIYVFDLKPSNQSGWEWQKCTEMVMPIGWGPNDTMFEAYPFDINNYTRDCIQLFGVTPRPNWVTTEFGGHDIKSVLSNFGSNIIFSNGLRDPYSSGGVLQDLSDSILAIYTNEGAHCADLQTPDPNNDPQWLVAQRDKEIKIIELWIAEYNAKLTSKVLDNKAP
ncbi:lysosomal Pro-X carboxypeptidase-like [Carica papaya]|uniref:lysosomal Pro-X carboxypeptidase-like n=1 Tax=Carica papaya TaxID=3649 RepID=UPI000B8D012E|nr:lysosomal Pro-X carboxypeptidase-like [Carica papaya]